MDEEREAWDLPVSRHVQQACSVPSFFSDVRRRQGLTRRGSTPGTIHSQVVSARLLLANDRMLTSGGTPQVNAKMQTTSTKRTSGRSRGS